MRYKKKKERHYFVSVHSYQKYKSKMVCLTVFWITKVYYSHYRFKKIYKDSIEHNNK